MRRVRSNRLLCPLALILLAGCARNKNENNAQTLRTAAEIAKLPSENVRDQVWIHARGVLTFWDTERGFGFFEDSTGGLKIQGTALGTQMVGQFVDIEG